MRTGFSLTTAHMVPDPGQNDAGTQGSAQQRATLGEANRPLLPPERRSRAHSSDFTSLLLVFLLMATE